MRELKKRRRKIINARKRKVWWRRNRMSALALTLSLIMFGIFINGVYIYTKSVDKMMEKANKPWQVEYINKLK